MSGESYTGHKCLYTLLLQMLRVADMAGVRGSLEKGEGREAILLLEGFPQGCRRARGIIQVSTMSCIGLLWAFVGNCKH